ncbi:MAG: class I SAM-dependent methyltransferase [Candidatus Omnitrophota bacterium]
MEKAICNICEKDNAESYCKLESPDFAGEIFDLNKCNECGLLFINPRPDTKEIKKYYPDAEYYAYSQAEGDSRKEGGFQELVKSIRRATIAEYYGDGKKYSFAAKVKNKVYAFFGKHRFGTAPRQARIGSILDVGCGDGAFLLHLKDLGWRVQGLEINSYAAKRAEEKGVKVYNQDLLDADFEGETFDVVRLWSVLEHLHDPSATIEKVGRILKKGGFLIIQTPNFGSLARSVFKEKWSAFDAPRHLYSFNSGTLRNIIEKNNFEIVKMHTISVGTIAASLKYNCAAAKPFLFISDAVLDVLNLGDCLVCYAKKK